MDDSGDRDTTIATGGTGDGGFSRDASGEVSASGGITTDGAGGEVSASGGITTDGAGGGTGNTDAEIDANIALDGSVVIDGGSHADLGSAAVEASGPREGGAVIDSWTVSSGPDFLIVAADNLAASAKRYRDFRRASGFNVDLAMVGDIEPSRNPRAPTSAKSSNACWPTIRRTWPPPRAPSAWIAATSTAW